MAVGTVTVGVSGNELMDMVFRFQLCRRCCEIEGRGTGVGLAPTLFGATKVMSDPLWWCWIDSVGAA